MKTILKVLGIVIIVVSLMVGGLYAAVSIPKEVDTVWTEKDLNSYMAKIGVSNFSNDNSSLSNIQNLLYGNFESIGSKHIDSVLTSSEVTAAINTAMSDNGILKDIRIKFGDDGTIETSACFSPETSKIYELYPDLKSFEKYIKLLENRPIYGKFALIKKGADKFDLITKELRIGRIPIPITDTGSYLQQADNTFNNIVSKTDGFYCEELEISKEGLHFKGTIPEKLEYR